MFVCAVIAILVVCNFTHSAPGRACLSIREDEIASEAMGINTTKYKVIAFVIGALLASLAGALFACNFYVIKPDQFTFNKSIDILVMVVFGGMGSMTSSVLAAVAIGIINVVLANFSEIRMIIYGLALVGIMIFKPTGILGTKELSFKKLLNLLAKELDKSKTSYYMLTGDTDKADRKGLVDAYQNDDTTVFLISLKAGGTGLNLTAAEGVIHFDPWWNMSAQNQATDRAYRIGQKNKVFVYKLIMADSIEEKIQTLQAAKKDLADRFVEGNSGSITTMSGEEIMSLFSED